MGANKVSTNLHKKTMQEREVGSPKTEAVRPYLDPKVISWNIMM